MSVRYFRNVEICVGFGHTSQKSVMSLTIMITLSLISARYLPQELIEREKELKRKETLGVGGEPK